MDDGIYDQNVLFNLIYPVYVGHYATLRDLIAIEKNR